MEPEWILAPLGTGRWGHYPFCPLTLSFLIDPGLLSSTFGDVWFCLEKKKISPNQREATAARENLGLGVLGPEFYVILLELAV